MLIVYLMLEKYHYANQLRYSTKRNHIGRCSLLKGSQSRQFSAYTSYIPLCCNFVNLQRNTGWRVKIEHKYFTSIFAQSWFCLRIPR